VAQSLGGPSAARVEVRSWLFASLRSNAAAALALPFWLFAIVGFVAAALSFWGVLWPGEAWRPIAVAAAVVSMLGTAFVAGIWPGSPNKARSLLNTSIALAMNAIILVTQLWLRWPTPALLGR
jgi:hypothetical protein